MTIPDIRPLHVRTIRVRSPRRPHELDVTATWSTSGPRTTRSGFRLDPPPVIHDMRLRDSAAPSDLVVTEVRSEMARPRTPSARGAAAAAAAGRLHRAGFTARSTSASGRERGSPFNLVIHAMAPRCGGAVRVPGSGAPGHGRSVVRQHLPGVARGGPLHQLSGRRRGGLRRLPPSRPTRRRRAKARHRIRRPPTTRAAGRARARVDCWRSW